jgi:hypothetical protein
MEPERTMQFILEQQARLTTRQAEHERWQKKFEACLLQINAVLLKVAATQVRTNAIVGVEGR